MNQPNYTVNQIVELIGGHLESGDGNANLTGVASLAEAQQSDVSFFGNLKYLPDLKKSKAGAILVKPNSGFEFCGAAIAVENPSTAFSLVMEKFIPPAQKWQPGIHTSAVIGEACEIHPTACIQPGVVLENDVKIGARTLVGANTFIGDSSVVGEDCHIYPNVTIRERSQIGHRVILHCGVVIGSDGYGFEMVDGHHKKIPQIGMVQLDDEVEIGANSTVDRARFGRTWIGEGTKIDNLVQVAHNVVIGKHCLIVGQAGISGSTHIGDYVVIAGQAGIVGHVKIGDRSIIAAAAVVIKSVPPDSEWMGYFAEPAKLMREKIACFSRLPKLYERVKALENKIPKDSI